MLIELHAHTSRHSSCSGLEPVELIRRAIARKLQGVLITEHHYLWSDDEIAQLRVSAGAESYFVILAAQETETDIGHVIVIGADETIPRGTSVDDIKKRYPETLLILAHPFRKGAIPSDGKLLDARIDAVEIFNSNQTMNENAAALAVWHRLKFNAIAGSDAHSPETVGLYPSIFDHPVGSLKELMAEIKNSRARPFYKEIPKSGGNTTVTEITFGTKGEDEYRRRIILRSFAPKASDEETEKKFKKAAKSAKFTAEIRKQGFSDGIYRVPAIIEIREDEKIIIEEGQRGKSLYEIISKSSQSTAAENFELAARWLARFHIIGLSRWRGTSNQPELKDAIKHTIIREKKRLLNYLKNFADTSNPCTEQARKLVAFVEDAEEKALTRPDTPITTCHGDFHPKNIIIGQDISHDISTRFISVIDFESVIAHHPAFDIGYFLAQTENQFFGKEAVLKTISEEKFINSYTQEFRAINPDPLLNNLTYENLVSLVGIFRIRAILSITSFLIKVGKGESPELKEAMLKADLLMKNYEKEPV